MSNEIETNYDNHQELMVYLNRRKFESQDNRLNYDQEIMEGYAYYWGYEPKPYLEGSSTYVDRFVYDQVMGLVAQLKDTLITADSVVKFNPLDSSMGRAAKIATYHINREIIQRNNGVNLLTGAIHTALLNKCSYLHPYWVNSTREEETYFDNLDEVDVNLMSQTVDEVVIERTDPETGLMSGYSVSTIDTSHLEIDEIPFEQVYIEPSASSFDTANYVCLKLTRLRSDFENEGIEIPDDAVLDESDNDTLFNYVRSDYMNIEMKDNRMDESTSYVTLYRHYAKMEYQGQYGIWSFLTSLYTVIDAELIDVIPIAQLQPLPNPLGIYSESVPDITKDIQEQRTFIMRGLQDNIMDSNHPTQTIIRNQVDPRAVMNKHPNRVLIVESQNAIQTFVNRPLTQEIGLAKQIIQENADTRIGLSNAAQGLSDDVFKNDNAFATVSAVMNQALQRTNNIASNIANGGLTKLMSLCYHIVRQNDEKVYNATIDGRPVQYSPSQWPELMDIYVDATISPVDKAAKLRNLKEAQLLLQNSPIVQQLQLVGPEEQYQMLAEQLKAMNLYGINDFVKPLEAGQQVPPNPADDLANQNIAADVRVKNASAAEMENKAKIILDKFKFEQASTANKDSLEEKKFYHQQGRDGVLDELEEHKSEQGERALDLKERELLLKEQELKLLEQKYRLEGYLENKQHRPVGIG